MVVKTKEGIKLGTKQIMMPKLGESVTEGTINSWLVQVGDTVNKYDPIAEVMTDKVNAEVPSSYAGTIKEIVVEEGDTVSVGELICYIEIEQAKEPSEKTISPSQTKVSVPTATKEKQSMRTRYSPAVLKLAADHQIDLQSVQGTGLGGRITRKDIKKYIKDEKNKQHVPSQPVEKESGEVQPIQKRDKEIAITGVRKAIAENMVRSKKEIPHAWMTVEADVTHLVTYRNQIKEGFKEREGYPITFFAFFVHAIARALKDFPELNGTWHKDKVIQRHDVNIAIAVAKENELFVPVIKEANEKSVTGIAKSIYQLAQKARSGQLQPEDMQGGTFTVNNTGTFGSVSSMGIISYPQIAILQVEAIVKRPVIINDMFAARDIVNLSLSLDHRVLDGLICGRFLARVKEILENIGDQTSIL